METREAPVERAKHKGAGFTLLEVLTASAISSLIMGALFIGLSSLQKTFKASEFHVTKQCEQMRFLDFLSLDLRRAITVNLSKSNAALTAPDIIDLTIPDFYTVDPTNPEKQIPRNPAIVNGAATYGSPANNPKIRYRVINGTLSRTQSSTIAGVATSDTKALCTEVEDFSIEYSRAGQVISTATSFLPRYQWSTNTQASYRAGTATFTNTLLRNTRLTTAATTGQ